jgi:hypothetical protein
MVLKPFSLYALWHESESLHHGMEVLSFSGFTFSSVMVRKYIFVAIVSTAAGFVRNGPSFYIETIGVGSFVVRCLDLQNMHSTWEILCYYRLMVMFK